MASVSWTATSGGSWNNAANWSAAPQQGDDVSINTQGSSITVTYGTGALALDSLSTGVGDTLDITGGTLSTSDGFSLMGSLVMSGGTLRLGGLNPGNLGNALNMSGGSLILADGATASGGVLTQTAGTITIGHGALTDQEGGSLAGTMNGAGAFILAAAQGVTTIFQSGFVLATGAADIAGGTVFLNEALNYGRKFSLSQQGTLDLNGHASKLTGYAALDGDVNGGSLTVSGGGHLNGMMLDNGAVLNVQGAIDETGNIQLGGYTGTGTLNVTSSGTLRITGNDSITQGSNAGYLVNGGLVEKTAGSSQAGTMFVTDTVTNAASAIIDAAVGTIDFRGPSGGQQSSIMGTLEGNGTVAFDAGSYLLSNVDLAGHRLLFAQSTNVTLATAETYGGNWQQTGGLLLLETALTLTGTSDFAGGELKGTATVTDSGGLLTLGSSFAVMDLEGNLSFAFNGAVDQVGAINLGALSDSVDQAVLGAGDTWSLEGASSISGSFGTITNNGTFARLDGAQNAIVASTLINNGALLVDTGTLSLTGQGTLAGTVGGGAVLDISGQFALAAGLALGVGELILDAPSQANDIQASLGGDLTYAHDFAIEGGTLALNGHTMTLNGISSFGTGAIQGSGVVVDNGATTIIGVALTQGGELMFNAATEQAGNVTLTGGSTAPILTIGAASVYTLDNGANIGGPNSSVVGTLTVQGNLVASGPGTSTIAASVVNTGTIAISHGQMQFLGPLTGAGAITISAGGILDLDSSNATTAGIGFGGGGGLLYLYAPSAYDGTIGGFASGDAVELNGFAFSNDGTPTSFSVSGDKVTITEAGGGPSMTLTFSTTQTATQLMLGVGPHSGLALIHI